MGLPAAGRGPTSGWPSRWPASPASSCPSASRSTRTSSTTSTSRRTSGPGGRIRASVDKSFVSAWRTIWTADVASLIGAVILYLFTVGAVRGFAFYLGLSTLLDLIISWFFMRPVVARATRSTMCAEHPHRFGLPDDDDVDRGLEAGAQAGHRGGRLSRGRHHRLYRGQNDIDFPKWWHRALVLSTALMLISIASFFTRGLNLGIDFEGGVSWQVAAPGVSVDHARTALGSSAGPGSRSRPSATTSWWRRRRRRRPEVDVGAIHAGQAGRHQHRPTSTSTPSGLRGARRSPRRPSRPWWSSWCSCSSTWPSSWSGRWPSPPSWPWCTT